MPIKQSFCAVCDSCGEPAGGRGRSGRNLFATVAQVLEHADNHDWSAGPRERPAPGPTPFHETFRLLCPNCASHQGFRPHTEPQS